MACKSNENNFFFLCIKIPKISGYVRTFDDLIIMTMKHGNGAFFEN